MRRTLRIDAEDVRIERNLQIAKPVVVCFHTGRDVELDTTFPLDDGENATVTLANESDAAVVLCDEFTQLRLIHASLAGPRLVTTPTLLAVLVRRDTLEAEAAHDVIDSISAARSWDANSYVRRARTLFDDSSASHG